MKRPPGGPWIWGPLQSTPLDPAARAHSRVQVADGASPATSPSRSWGLRPWTATWTLWWPPGASGPGPQERPGSSEPSIRICTPSLWGSRIVEGRAWFKAASALWLARLLFRTLLVEPLQAASIPSIQRLPLSTASRSHSGAREQSKVSVTSVALGPAATSSYPHRCPRRVPISASSSARDVAQRRLPLDAPIQLTGDYVVRDLVVAHLVVVHLDREDIADARDDRVGCASRSIPVPSMAGCLAGSARRLNTRSAGTSIRRDTETRW
jgi:hypothetical protein